MGTIPSSRCLGGRGRDGRAQTEVEARPASAPPSTSVRVAVPRGMGLLPASGGLKCSFRPHPTSLRIPVWKVGGTGSTSPCHSLLHLQALSVLDQRCYKNLLWKLPTVRVRLPPLGVLCVCRMSTGHWV